MLQGQPTSVHRSGRESAGESAVLHLGLRHKRRRIGSRIRLATKTSYMTDADGRVKTTGYLATSTESTNYVYDALDDVTADHRSTGQRYMLHLRPDWP